MKTNFSRLSLAIAALSMTGLIGCLAGAKSAPAVSAPAEYNVRNYGATGDGITLDISAINKAIDAAAAGGGRCTSRRACIPPRPSI